MREGILNNELFEQKKGEYIQNLAIGDGDQQLAIHDVDDAEAYALVAEGVVTEYDTSLDHNGWAFVRTGKADRHKLADFNDKLNSLQDEQ